MESISAQSQVNFDLNTSLKYGGFPKDSGDWVT